VRAFPVATLIALVLAVPLRASAWEPRCVVDEPLGEAAASLLLAGAPLDAASLTRAAREAGSDLPTVHAVALGDDDEARGRAWLEALAARSDAPLVCGHARDATRLLLLASPRGGALAHDAGSETMRLSLAPRFDSPRLVVLDAHGVLHAAPLGLDEATAELPTDAARPLRVQLVATGPAGPRPVAERVVGDSPLDAASRARLAAEGVHVNDAPVRAAPSAVVSASAPVDAAPGSATAAEVASRLAASRRAAGRAAVRPHRLLARAALAHAQAVCATGRVAHQLEAGASPEDRLAALGVRARFVGEALGRASDLDAAWAALLASPSHREALLEPRFTDAGTAATRDARGRVCVAVSLAAWPRLVPPRRAASSAARATGR
jgi:uncharacterized protein YkwD